MELKPIRTDDDHDVAIREIERLWDAKPGTDDHDKLDILGQLVSAYEEKRWPINPPDPIEAIKFRMEQSGYTNADLARVIGSWPRATEVLKKRRALTVKMIHALTTHWHIPAETLLTPYKLMRPSVDGTGNR